MIQQATGVMMRLRNETADHHARAEGKPLEQSLVAGRLPLPMFVRLLEQRFLVHASLEPAVSGLRSRDSRLSAFIHDELFQLENLRRDLAHFGRDPERLPPLASTRQLTTEITRLTAKQPIALLGVYYVFEGSKNGARFIAKRVGPVYQLKPGTPGMLYLDPHGENQRQLWQNFKLGMDACNFAPADQDAMVAAAQMTFDRVADMDDELFNSNPG